MTLQRRCHAWANITCPPLGSSKQDINNLVQEGEDKVGTAGSFG